MAENVAIHVGAHGLDVRERVLLRTAQTFASVGWPRGQSLISEIT